MASYSCSHLWQSNRFGQNTEETKDISPEFVKQLWLSRQGNGLDLMGTN